MARGEVAACTGDLSAAHDALSQVREDMTDCADRARGPFDSSLALQVLDLRIAFLALSDRLQGYLAEAVMGLTMEVSDGVWGRLVGELDSIAGEYSAVMRHSDLDAGSRAALTGSRSCSRLLRRGLSLLLVGKETGGSGGDAMNLGEDDEEKLGQEEGQEAGDPSLLVPPIRRLCNRLHTALHAMQAPIPGSRAAAVSMQSLLASVLSVPSSGITSLYFDWTKSPFLGQAPTLL
jgi:hypothetical protein